MEKNSFLFLLALTGLSPYPSISWGFFSYLLTSEVITKFFAVKSDFNMTSFEVYKHLSTMTIYRCVVKQFDDVEAS